MKKTILLFLLLNLIVQSWSQNIRLAVPVFTPKNDFSRDEAEALTDLFTSYLVEAGGFEVLSRTEIDKLLAETQFQAEGLTSETDYARMGAALNANSIIAGNLMKLGSKGYFTVSIIEVETFKVISSSRTPFDDLNEIVDKMPQLTEALTIQISDLNKLIGTWEGSEGEYTASITFYRDGTFVVPLYDVTEKSLWKKETQNEYVWSGLRIRGRVTGTYSYTAGEFTLNGILSGYSEISHNYKSGIEKKPKGNIISNLTLTINYRLSNNNQNMETAKSEIFARILYLEIGEKLDNYEPIYISKFSKIN